MPLLQFDQPPRDMVVGRFSYSHVAEADSTQTALRARLATLPVWFLPALSAERQTAGRGRHGRQWHSPPGNLALSYGVPARGTLATSTPHPMFLIAILGLLKGLEQALRRAGATLPDDRQLSLKWPNDVMLGDGKLAGLLIEVARHPTTGEDWYIVGQGVNVVTAPAGLPYPAASLAGVAPTLDQFNIACAVLGQVWGLLGQWSQRPDPAPLHQRWRQRLGQLGQSIRVRLPGPVAAVHGSTGQALATGPDLPHLEGVFRDVDARGNMLLTLPGGSEVTLAAADLLPPFTAPIAPAPDPSPWPPPAAPEA